MPQLGSPEWMAAVRGLAGGSDAAAQREEILGMLRGARSAPTPHLRATPRLRAIPWEIVGMIRGARTPPARHCTLELLPHAIPRVPAPASAPCAPNPPPCS